MKEHKKEVVFYSIIVVILIVISILNNTFLKLGKEKDDINKNIQKLEINNITYDIPFEEKWLD